jgi:hypothetical protein
MRVRRLDPRTCATSTRCHVGVREVDLPVEKPESLSYGRSFAFVIGGGRQHQPETERRRAVMIETVVDILVFAIVIPVAAPMGFVVGSLRIAIDLMPFLPTNYEYRSWGALFRSVDHGWIAQQPRLVKIVFHHRTRPPGRGCCGRSLRRVLITIRSRSWSRGSGRSRLRQPVVEVDPRRWGCTARCWSPWCCYGRT